MHRLCWTVKSDKKIYGGSVSMKVVNSAISKIDGMDIATGKPVYTDDLDNNSLVVKILRSPYAFAKIKHIDIEKAEKLNGVECILTYKDVPNARFTTAGQSYPEPSPYDRLILDEYVRYVGDEVAAVALVPAHSATISFEYCCMLVTTRPP